MERKTIWKKTISLLLIISLLFGMTGTGTWVKAASDVPAELAGYTKIGPENFGITEEVVHTFESAVIEQPYYGSTSCLDRKVYFDADVMLPVGGLQSNNIAYLNQWLLRIYLTEDTLVVYSTAKDMVLLYQTSWTDLGIKAGEYFHLQLATDMTDNSEDSSLTDIKVQLWVNEKKVTALDDTITVSDAHAQGTNLYVNMTQAGTTKIRPHVEEPKDPFEGYTKIGPENFGITEEVVHTFESAVIEQPYYGSTSCIDRKVYFDADVELPVGGLQSNNIAYLNQWLLRVYLTEDTLVVYSTAKDMVLLYQTSWADLGIKAGEYFHLQLATDMKDNAEDSSLTDIKVQLWVNESKVTPLDDTITVSDAHAQGTNLYVNMTQAGTTKIRPHVEEPKDPFEGYTKIGPENFGITEEVVHTFESAVIEQPYYGSTSCLDRKVYFDADVMLPVGGLQSNNIAYLNQWLLRIYLTEDTLVVYSTAKDMVLLYQTSWTDLGIKAGEYFHLQLATDMTDNSEDSSLTDIKVQLWVNEKKVTALDDTITVSDAHAQGTNLYVNMTQAGTIKVRPHVEKEPQTPPQPVETDWTKALKDYKKVTLQDFGVAQEEILTFNNENIDKTYYWASDIQSFHQTYLDADIALARADINSAFGYLNQYLIRLYIIGDELAVYSLQADKLLYQVKISDYEIVPGEYFNLKLATDIVDNTSNDANSDVTVQMWINEKYVTPTNNQITVEDTYIGSWLNVTLQQEGNMKLKPQVSQEPQDPPTPPQPPQPPQPVETDWTKALKDYKKVTLQDYGIFEETTHTNSGKNVEQNYYYLNEISSFNKTYLDADIALTKADINSGLGYLNEYLLRIYMVDDTLAVYSLQADKLLYQSNLTDLGIKEGEYFNLKLATDIIDNASDTTMSDVKVQMWIDEKYVTPINDTITVTDAYVGSWINVTLQKEGTIKLKPEVQQGADDTQKPSDTGSFVIKDMASALKGYTRVTPNTFAIIEEQFKHGWTQGNWMGYEYPESLDHTYLDVDIALCKDDTFNNSIRYLSKNGWESLQIGISGDALVVYETSTNTVVYRVSLGQAGIAADEYFNMKLRTDIKGKTISLALWINDTLVRSVTGKQVAEVKGCKAIGSMMGIYLPYEGSIRMKTPKSSGADEQKPNKTEQPNANFKQTTFESFAVKDGKYDYIGTELATKGTYILSVNETVFSGNFHFSKVAGADFRYGGKNNPWNGLRFWTTGDGKLYMQDATEKTEKYAFHPMYAGTQLIDNTFNMKLSVEFVDSDKDGLKDDVKLGVWFNDVLYQNSYITLKDYAPYLGNACSVYVMNPEAWLEISSDKAVYTGVDFTLFGFTNNWKKEMGIK